MMETDPNKRHQIEFKSILLDVIEKYKTFERVNRANSVQTFKHEQHNKGIDNTVCAEVLKPEKMKKAAHDPYLQEGDLEDHISDSSMQLELIFLNDMPTLKRKLIESPKTKYMGADKSKRLNML